MAWLPPQRYDGTNHTTGVLQWISIDSPEGIGEEGEYGEFQLSGTK